MFDPRFRSSYLLAIVLAIGACHSSSYDTQFQPASDGGDDSFDTSEFARRDAHGRPDAALPHRDAAVDAALPHRDAAADAASPPPDAGGGSGGDAGVHGEVSCYTASRPTTTCTLPTHCCFSNYSWQHDGSCGSSSCSWGTIDCDGPEDCASGQRCCAHVIIDPEDGILGYKLACQTAACGPAPANEELCHPTASAAGTCSNGGACISTFGNYNDLPRSLYICQ